jgi:LPS sulfotransferase NodH
MILPFEKISVHEQTLREYFAEFDIPADTTPLGKPVCIMLFTNRSGSSLVSEHMRSTPHFTGFGEPLNSKWVIDRCEREGLKTFADYLRFEADRLYQHKPGAVLGMKASYGQAMMLMRCGAIPGFFNDVRWVVIQRDDLLSQAVSFAIADQTKQWHSFDQGEAVDPVYDYDDIRRRLQGFSLSYMAINMFCAVFDIHPYRIVYDEFARDPVAGAGKLAAFLGVHDVTIDPAGLQMVRQRNRFSERFRQQFILDYQADMRDRVAAGGDTGADAG